MRAFKKEKLSLATYCVYRSVICEDRSAPGTNERSVDVEARAQERYIVHGEELDQNSNKRSPQHEYATIQEHSKNRRVGNILILLKSVIIN